MDWLSKRMSEGAMRVAHLREKVAQTQGEPAACVVEALAELESAFEELQAAQDQLNLQSQQLVQAQVEIEAERRRYHDLFEFAPDGYVVTDASGVIREANRAAAGMLGVPAKVLAGTLLVTFVADDQRRAFRADLVHVTEPDRPREWELRLIPRHGEPFVASVRVSPMIDGKDRRREALRWLLRDVTIRKKSEEELQQANAELEVRVQRRTGELAAVGRSKAKLLIQAESARAEADRRAEQAEEGRRVLDALIEYMPVGVVIADAGGLVTHMSREGRRIRDLNRSEVEGLPLQAINEKYPLLRPGASEPSPVGNLPLTRAIQGGEVIRNEEWQVRTPDGRMIPIVCNAGPLFGPQGDIVGAIATWWDHTALKTAQHEAEQRARELDEANRHKDEFLATLAHELRNPLAPIRNVIQLMRHWDTTDSDLRWAVDLLDRQTRQMTRLVDDLLDVSRIARRKIELRIERAAIGPIVVAALESVRGLVESRRHLLALDLPPEPIYLRADTARLTQVVTNLLTNAAKYTDPGGRIVVQVRREGQEVVLRVRDNGIGLSEDMLKRIFHPFVQADHSSTRSQGGLGIGLSLVKELVELHGGSVMGQSDGPGKGCEFVVRLPALPAESDEGGNAPAERERCCRRLRVLVVDDRADAAESLGVLLRLWGHEVRVAFDGPAALTEARAFDPEAVLLDLGLPGLSGFDVAERLRQELPRPNRLLIALTGYGNEEDRDRSRQVGFDLHLTKPVDPEALHRFLADFAGV